MNLWVKILILIVAILMLLGAIMVFTASGTFSYYKFQYDYYMFIQHSIKVVLAVFAMIFAARFPYERYRKYSKWALLAILFTLLITLFVAPKVKGAQRWFLFFQPSEVAKVILIIHLASMLEKFGDKIKDFKQGFIFPLIWISLAAGLVIAQPNVSTSIIIGLTSFMVLFVAGAQWKHIIGVFSSAGILVGSLALIFHHSRQRILSYINSILNGSDINIQVKQAKIALGSGGLLGVGPGHSRQSDLFLPESYADFIFSILGEELGFVGTVGVLVAYFVLFLVCLVIAKKAQDKFGQLMVVGLAFNIVISGFINAAVVTGLLPTTGITLPFISYGGTSIILFAFSIGVIINVGRQTAKTQELKIAQV
ncbi:MAG: FtsW/RodA/SpoVE family cell cycle protein [Melioribacteraceae bacterium]|nr:FtsW/RodA/SpoVE family cell cycle protein [Melioribacteraceae bacterium]